MPNIRREWSPEYMTYTVYEDQSRLSMSCSPLAVSVSTNSGNLIFTPAEFKALATEMLQHIDRHQLGAQL